MTKVTPLIQQVKQTLAIAPLHPCDKWENEARSVIKTIADWLDHDGHKSAASRLKHQLTVLSSIKVQHSDTP